VIFKAQHVQPKAIFTNKRGTCILFWETYICLRWS